MQSVFQTNRSKLHVRKVRVTHSGQWTLTLALAGLLFTSHSFGGTKGFTAVFIDIGDSNFFSSSVYGNMAAGNFTETRARIDCWGERATGGKSFNLMIKKAIPDGLTIDMVKAIWSGNQTAAKEAQQIMAGTKAPNRQNIDGLYVIDARDGHISVFALGTKAPLGAKNPSRKLTIPWKESDPEQGAADFDLALCRVSRPLDYHFSP